jgi:hypothetical protein
MQNKNTKWESYEAVAQHLIEQFAANFNLGKVEGKQIVPGKSGTNWEIDAKGIKKDDGAFIIIKCRRHTTSSLNQEAIGALSFRIQDSGAKGGIVVSPLDLQAGAKKVAEYSNIHHVILSPESTTTDYILKFLNKIFVGASKSLSVGQRVNAQIVKNGIVIKEKK